MKKIMGLISLVLTFGCLTGCNNTNTEITEKLLKSMKKEKIVEKNIELIDEVNDMFVGYIYNKTKYYIYKEENGDLIAISFTNNIHEDLNCKYIVTLYNDVVLNNDFKYLEDTGTYEQFYTYKDGSSTDKNKYLLKDKNTYYVYEQESLFGTKYKFKLQKQEL